MPRHSSDRSEPPAANRRESPRRRSPSRRERSPPHRHRSSRRSRSPVRSNISSRSAPEPRSPPPPSREKHHSTRARSPKRSGEAVKSPPPQSPSPRTKRLRRAQAAKEAERNGSGKDRERASRHREKGSEREVVRERGERRSERDGNGGERAKSRRERSDSPADRRRRERRHSRSPPRAARNGTHDEEKNSRGTEKIKTDDDPMSKMQAAEEALEAKQKQKPSFELSGKLAAETNRVRGITLLFNEPPDARKPDIRWRLYVFKASEVLNEPLYIHRQSCYLFGRERRVADIPTDHPSCSKQHAVIQFRQVEKEQPDGMLSKQVRPYLMDLGSTNKTFLNDNPIEPQRYYELFEKDTVKFGNSSREYVLLHENSAT